MNKILLSFVFISGFMSATVDSMLHGQTERVMRVLRESKTLFRSSTDWKKRVPALNFSAETVVAKTHVADYPGLAAYFYYLSHKMNPLHLKEDSVSGHFTIKNNDDVVEIHSELVTTQMTEVDLSSLKKHGVDGIMLISRVDLDSHSVCQHTLQGFFEVAKCRMGMKTLSKCVTKMPVDEFMNAINKSN